MRIMLRMWLETGKAVAFASSQYRSIFAALVIGVGALSGYAATSNPAQNTVTAIDIALEPDAVMIQRADAANGRLREVFPKGYSLDSTHSPHITMLQRYVRTADLDKVYAAVDSIIGGQRTGRWKLKADKYAYVVWNGVAVTVIAVERTVELTNLQKKLIDAVAPFTVKSGTAAAFVTTQEEPDINQPTINYVAQFVPASTGGKFEPHVTVGVADERDVKKIVAEPFKEFTFSPAAVSVYQLGNFGTARTKLKTWELKP